MQLRQAISSVLETTKQETDIYDRWLWVEASIWTKPMLTALENGVKGGKWFSLMDKVYAMATLQAAWQQVQRNKGSHGVDGMSVERFAQKQEQYLQELQQALKEVVINRFRSNGCLSLRPEEEATTWNSSS